MRIKRWICIVVLLVLSPPARAEVEERLDELENRMEQVEKSAGSGSGFMANSPEWMRRFHLSGNADFSYLYGEENSLADHGRLAVENARLFLDVDLGGEARLFDHTVMESASFYFEWDIFRKAAFQNDVGSLYLRLDSLGGSEAFNLKFGRFPLPFGEEYVRFHEKRFDNPLISFSTASVYGLDEGILLFGSLRNGLFQYMFAVTDGDHDIAQNSSSEPALTAKLVLEPKPWLHLSASAHRTGLLGPTAGTSFGKSALMFGEFGLYPILKEPLFQNGVPAPKDPSRKLKDIYGFEVDLVLHDARYGRLWLSYGRVFAEADSTNFYDRDMHYWTAEGVFELGAVCEALDRFYAALRYSAIGTFDDDKGWRLRVMNNGGNLGYNVDHVQSINVGFGVRLLKNLIFKAEYSWFDFNLVRGASAALGGLEDDRDYGGVSFSLEF